MRFSTLLVAAGTASIALAAPLDRPSKRASKLQFFGVNESGPEFGTGNIPGTEGTE